MGMGNGRQFPCVAAFCHTLKEYGRDSGGININSDLTKSLKILLLLSRIRYFTAIALGEKNLILTYYFKSLYYRAIKENTI
jgi:hypothetical protein